MASITVQGMHSQVILSEPDEDGDYSWNCASCLARADAYRPLDEAIASAEIHVDMQCPA